jgi:hypothetical protein
MTFYQSKDITIQGIRSRWVVHDGGEDVSIVSKSFALMNEHSICFLNIKKNSTNEFAVIAKAIGIGKAIGMLLFNNIFQQKCHPSNYGIEG